MEPINFSFTLTVKLDDYFEIDDDILYHYPDRKEFDVEGVGLLIQRDIVRKAGKPIIANGKTMLLIGVDNYEFLLFDITKRIGGN